jgi:kynurenine formamidase
MDELIAAVVNRGELLDLGQPLFNGLPQYPAHAAFRHTLSPRHGDAVRADGGSSAGDLLVTGTHVGTHVDAVGHISQDGRLHGGADAAQVQTGGRLSAQGVDELEPVLCRAVVLDIPGLLGVEVCPADLEVTPDHLTAAVDRQATPVRPGDAVLVRTGWSRYFGDPVAYVGAATGTPGVGVQGARWLAAQGVRLAGAETLAFERVAADVGPAALPVHGVLLVEHGINLVEVMNLEEVARRSAWEFALVLTPLKILGATGSPVRPVALVAS